MPITEPWGTNTCFNIYSLGLESMVVQLSILPQPSGICLTKQMAFSEFFFRLGRRVEACTARILDSICLLEYILWTEAPCGMGRADDGGGTVRKKRGSCHEAALKKQTNKKQKFETKKIYFQVAFATNLLRDCKNLFTSLSHSFLICETVITMFLLLTSHTFIRIKQVGFVLQYFVNCKKLHPHFIIP